MFNQLNSLLKSKEMTEVEILVKLSLLYQHYPKKRIHDIPQNNTPRIPIAKEEERQPIIPPKVNLNF